MHGLRLHYVTSNDRSVVRSRLLFTGLSLFAVFAIGVAGYYWIGGGHWRLRDCAYMVLITITTVGYAEVLPVSKSLQGQAFTMGLLISGMGVSLYFLSALTAFIIEGDLREALWRRKMQRRLQKLAGHYIVCGAGRTGAHVVDEVLAAGKKVVVIERERGQLARLSAQYGDAFIGLVDDATDDRVLRDAGVERAAGIVTALKQDQDNLFVALSARQLNPDLRIVSRSLSERTTPKLLMAGADVAVNPTNIGGRRMAHELLRPNVVGFLDVMTSERERNLNIEDVRIPVGSPLCGRTLARSRIREVSNALVLAVKNSSTQSHTFNPPADFEFREGMTLIVLGEREEIERLHGYVSGKVPV